MLDLSLLSTIICPILTAVQSALDTLFTTLSLGTAPVLTTLLGSVFTFGC